jgi:sporulation protein YtfJ
LAEHPIQGLMSTAMENIKHMIDVNTIIGDPVETPDGTVIIPVSRVGFGFAAGGSEFEQAAHDKGKVNDSGPFVNGHPFGGGAGGGVSISPMGFLIVGHGNVKLLSTEGTSQIYDKLAELVPSVMDKVQAMTKKGNQGQNHNPEHPHADDLCAEDEGNRTH